MAHTFDTQLIFANESEQCILEFTQVLFTRLSAQYSTAQHAPLGGSLYLVSIDTWAFSWVFACGASESQTALSSVRGTW